MFTEIRAVVLNFRTAYLPAIYNYKTNQTIINIVEKSSKLLKHNFLMHKIRLISKVKEKGLS